MYFLEYEAKEETLSSVRLGISNGYKTFEGMVALTKFLFENAIYINSYKIYKASLHEEEETTGSFCVTAGSGISNSYVREGFIRVYP